MIAKLLKRRRTSGAPIGSIPPGTRVYAIGDIHGRLDLLDELVGRIDADDAGRAPSRTMLVFLGDLVDRGPDSAGVVERLRLLAEARSDTHFLTGNHEEVMLAAVAGDAKALRLFCRIGGRETMTSYGLDEAGYERMDYGQVGDWLARAIPQAHRDFLASFEDLIVLGSYAFVHAGIRPGVELSAQSKTDLRWIRESFLDHDGTLERIIVHGHTISDAVEYRRHRIGIDTGAFASGRLTALGLENDVRWVLQT